MLGGCLTLFPLLTGRGDVPTTLVVAAIAGAAILPVWRHAGQALTTPVTFIPLLEIVIGPIVIARLFSALAAITYIGAWAGTLGLARFVTGWRDDD